MHILFVDESGTPPKPNDLKAKYFVISGIIIPESAWHRVRDAVMGLKIRRSLRGEIKWRYFSPNNDDQKNPMRKLDSSERDQIRSEIYNIIRSERSLKIIACVCSNEAAYGIQSIQGQNDIYNLTYKCIIERFQYYLQDVGKDAGGRMEYGIIVSDHRSVYDDAYLRKHHQKLLHSSGQYVTEYKNLIEGLFFAPSHQSIGIQLADLVAGAVWRKYERQDERWFSMIEGSLRTSAKGEVNGYGLVKVPKGGWR